MYIDKYLIDKILNGDEKAFKLLYDTYKKRVYKTIILFFRNHQYAEDITQEVFIQIYQKLNQLKSPEAFESWMNKIIFNLCMKQVLKDKKFEVIYYDDLSNIKDVEEMNPENYSINEEFCSEIISLIHELPIYHRIPIILYYYYDLSIQEISKIMKCSQGTIKSRLFNGKNVLKKKINLKSKKEG